MIDLNKLPCDRSPNGQHRVGLHGACAYCGAHDLGILSEHIEAVLDAAERSPLEMGGALKPLRQARVHG